RHPVPPGRRTHVLRRAGHGQGFGECRLDEREHDGRRAVKSAKVCCCLQSSIGMTAISVCGGDRRDRLKEASACCAGFTLPLRACCSKASRRTRSRTTSPTSTPTGTNDKPSRLVLSLKCSSRASVIGRIPSHPPASRRS